MAIIGRASAVAQMGRWQCSGYLAWLDVAVRSSRELVEFENQRARLDSVGLVLLQPQSRRPADYRQGADWTVGAIAPARSRIHNRDPTQSYLMRR